MNQHVKSAWLIESQFRSDTFGGQNECISLPSNPPNDQDAAETAGKVKRGWIASEMSRSFLASLGLNTELIGQAA